MNNLSRIPLSSHLEKLFDKVKEKNLARSNDNIHSLVSEQELKIIEMEVERGFDYILRTLMIDVDNDHNSKDTPRRYAKMLMHETLKGRYQKPPTITDFPNASNLDQLIFVGGIRVESLCSHHHQNIRGVCHIGVLPEEKVIGLSKFSRIVDNICRRPQIQEEMTVQIMEAIKEYCGENVGVVIEAEHQCMSVRGVQEQDALTITTAISGKMKTHAPLLAEFHNNINMYKMRK